MFLFTIFGKMRRGIEAKVAQKEPGLYVVVLFPIVVSFLLTFAANRLIGYLITYGYIRNYYLEPSPGLHVHHFTYGFFILAIAGYLALIYNGPRAKYLIALLLGLGLGLAMDEFGMWLKLRDDEIARWNYDGFTLVIGLFVFLFTIKGMLRGGVKIARFLWPFGPRNRAKIDT